MKKARADVPNPPGDDMRGHYDFSGGVRGKYAARYAEGVTIVIGPHADRSTGRKVKVSGGTTSRLRDSRSDKPVKSGDTTSGRDAASARKRR